MYRRADLSRTIKLVVALCLAAASTGVFAREFRAADTQNEDYPTVQALGYMGSLVAERSGGRHQIKVFHSRQLGEEKETLEQTRVGAIDLNRTNVALIGTIVPSMNVLAMPFLFRSIEHLQKVLDGPIGNEILDSFEPYGFVGPRILRFRRALDLQQRPADPLDRRPQGIADAGAAIRTDVGDDPRARRRAGRTALRTGADRARHQTDRRRREQLAVLRHHRSLQVRRLLHADRTHDEPRSPGHVAQGLVQPVGRRPEDLPRGGARSSRFMREKWRDLEERSRKQAEEAGVKIITDFDRKPFEAAMAGIYAKAQHDPAMAS